MEFNLSQVVRAVAAAVPDRPAIVRSGTDQRTFAELVERSDRLAAVLAGAGLGAHRDRADLAPWESGQDHLALYLQNGPEYLEGMLGAYAARVAPFNVNYRYVAEELRYLLDDSGAAAIVYHSTFAPVLAEVRADLPHLRAPAPGRRRVRERAARRRPLVRGRAGRRAADASGGGTVARRPLHPLHRRHDRDAQGRAVAPGRHLPGGTRRAAAGDG